MIVSRVVRRLLQVRRDLLWRSLRPARRLSTGLEVEVGSRADWMLFNDIFVEGEYDPAISRVLDSRPEQPLILDLGANVGFFSLRFADLWMSSFGGRADFRIVAVEAVPALAAEYERRLAQPPLRDRVSLHRGLVGRRSGEAEITTPPFHATGSTRSLARRGRRLRVRYLDLERLLPPEERIALLKCDVEGAEEEFLESYPALLQRIDNLVVELHPTLCDPPRCRRLVENAGLLAAGDPTPGERSTTVELFSRPPSATGTP